MQLGLLLANASPLLHCRIENRYCDRHHPGPMHYESALEAARRPQNRCDYWCIALSVPLSCTASEGRISQIVPTHRYSIHPAPTIHRLTRRFEFHTALYTYVPARECHLISVRWAPRGIFALNAQRPCARS